MGLSHSILPLTHVPPNINKNQPILFRPKLSNTILQTDTVIDNHILKHLDGGII